MIALFPPKIRQRLPEIQVPTSSLIPCGRCLIYADRPFGCRTHFCAAAGGPYARSQVLDLIRRLEVVDQRLGGDGPRKIESALAAALAEIR